MTQVVEALLPVGPQRDAVVSLLERQHSLYLGNQTEINRAVMAAIKSVRKFGDLRTSMPRGGRIGGDRKVT